MSFSGKSVKSLEAKASTKIPTSLGQDGALDFSLWDRIGDEFMVQSNINSWVSCKPDTGSLVNPTTGEISCKMVKPSARAAKLGCAKRVPNRIQWGTNGPHLSASSLYYYWDGEASGSWVGGAQQHGRAKGVALRPQGGGEKGLQAGRAGSSSGRI